MKDILGDKIHEFIGMSNNGIADCGLKVKSI